MDIVLKKPTTFQEQVEILTERGLIIEDATYASLILSRVNYYRFSAYLLPFRISGTDKFKPGIYFNKIVRIYEFDNKLRNQILAIIEPIEILIRTQVAYHFAHKYGAEGYKDPSNFDNPSNHEYFIKEFERVISNNSKTLFVQHHLEKYGGKFPIWVAVELFSIGMLSKFYSNK